MAFEYAVGSFACPTSTGNFTPVTGLSFQPKLVRFFWNTLASSASDVNASGGVGAAISDSSRFCIAWSDLDAAATSDCARRHDNLRCITMIGADGTVGEQIDFVAFTSDGFTLDMETDDDIAHIVFYEAFGGADLTNVFIKEFTTRSTAGSQSITGVGFQPEAIALYCAGNINAPADSEPTVSIGIGVATSTTARGAVAIRADDNDTAGDTSHGQATDACLLIVNNAGATTKADLSSFDADGFSLSYSAASAVLYCWAICWLGGDYKVGQITQKTSTGNEAYTGVGFVPAGVSFLSTNDASNSDQEAEWRLSIGAGQSSTARGCIWSGSVDAADPTQSDKNLDTGAAIKMMTAGTPTTEAVADFYTRDADGFTLNWTTADATARTIIYMAFGPGTAGGGPPAASSRSLALLGVGT